MKIYNFNFNEKSKYYKNSLMVLGSFYTMHIGHQKLFSEAVKLKKRNLKIGALLLKESGNFMQSQQVFSLEWRIKYMKELGFDFLVIFEKNIFNFSIEPLHFLESLKQAFGLSEIIIGSDFKFGKNKSMSAKELLRNSSYRTKSLDLVKYNDGKISSFVVINSIKNAELDFLKKILGRPYSVSGKIIHGEKNGSKIGFPTANIDLNSIYDILPEGVYLTLFEIDDLLYPSITSVGRKETFHNSWKKTYETYILNFDKEIYTKNAEVHFLKKIRDQKKFSSVDKLIKQIRKDVDYSIDWFITNKY